MLSGFYRFSNVAHDTRCQRGGTDQGGDDGTDGVDDDLPVDVSQFAHNC